MKTLLATALLVASTASFAETVDPELYTQANLTESTMSIDTDPSVYEQDVYSMDMLMASKAENSTTATY